MAHAIPTKHDIIINVVELLNDNDERHSSLSDANKRVIYIFEI